MSMLFVNIFIFSLIVVARTSDEADVEKPNTVDCSTLRLGQFICPDPSISHIDIETQQIKGCTKGKMVPQDGEAEGNNYIKLVMF